MAGKDLNSKSVKLDSVLFIVKLNLLPKVLQIQETVDRLIILSHWLL